MPSGEVRLSSTGRQSRVAVDERNAHIAAQSVQGVTKRTLRREEGAHELVGAEFAPVDVRTLPTAVAEMLLAGDDKAKDARWAIANLELSSSVGNDSPW